MRKFKVVQIGASGHYEYALPTMKKYGFDFAAIAPGDATEDISGAVEKIRRLGFDPKIYSDWRGMLDEISPDIAVINPYMAYNAEMSAYALSHGINVFCEKPVATTFADLNMLKNAYDEASEKSGAKFCGMFGILYTPHFEAARKYIEGGALGDVRLINAQKSYRLGKRESFYSSRELLGGTIPWVAIHAIDWIYALCGFGFKAVTAAHSTVANGGNGDLEATALMMFEGENGALASVSADYLRPSAAPTHDDDRIRIVGTKGILEVRGGNVYLISDKGEQTLENIAPARELFEEFALEISGEGTCRVTAKETFDATYIALLARQSADLGRKTGIEL
ncbi:MAG: Gfo/Idh/MocA family oxidoreductase [Clostridia bacterium]|nr:Gfo/Idh/MocA family oxidoreductase [Clostridia bacterium]